MDIRVLASHYKMVGQSFVQQVQNLVLTPQSITQAAGTNLSSPIRLAGVILGVRGPVLLTCVAHSVGQSTYLFSAG